MNGLQVMLTDEQAASLRIYIFETAKEAISEAKEVAGLDKVFLKKGEMAKWLGISYNTLSKLEREGLPSIKIDGLQLYSKEEVKAYLLAKQN